MSNEYLDIFLNDLNNVKTLDELNQLKITFKSAVSEETTYFSNLLNISKYKKENIKDEKELFDLRVNQVSSALANIEQKMKTFKIEALGIKSEKMSHGLAAKLMQIALHKVRKDNSSSRVELETFYELLETRYNEQREILFKVYDLLYPSSANFFEADKKETSLKRLEELYTTLEAEVDLLKIVQAHIKDADQDPERLIRLLCGDLPSNDTDVFVEQFKVPLGYLRAIVKKGSEQMVSEKYDNRELVFAAHKMQLFICLSIKQSAVEIKNGNKSKHHVNSFSFNANVAGHLEKIYQAKEKASPFMQKLAEGLGYYLKKYFDLSMSKETSFVNIASGCKQYEFEQRLLQTPILAR